MTDGPGERITSPRNPRIVAARRLRLRKERVAVGAFTVEGPHAVTEALRSELAVHELFVTPAAAQRLPELGELAAGRGVPVTPVDERVAEAIADTVHPQGVFAVVGIPATGLADVFDPQPRLVAVLVGVTDPGNAGTVIRTADAAGADAVVLTAGSVDPYGGKCVRASAGSLFHLPIVTGVATGDVVAMAGARGMDVFAAVLDGHDLYDLGDRLRNPTVWLFGSEAHGLDDAVAASADERVRVPMWGQAESLNLATAAAVCLYASAGARR